MLVKKPLSAASTAFTQGNAFTSHRPNLAMGSDDELCFETAASRDRIECNFHASVRLCLNVQPDGHVAAENGRESGERPGRTAPGFVLDIDSDTAAGRFGARIIGVSVALRLFDEDVTLWGAVSPGIGAITGSAPAYRARLPRGMSLL